MKSAIQPNYGLRETIRVVLFLSRFQRFLLSPPDSFLSLFLFFSRGFSSPLSFFSFFLSSLSIVVSTPALFVNSALLEVSFPCRGKRGKLHFFARRSPPPPASSHDARHPLHIFTIAKTAPPTSWKCFSRARDDSAAPESKNLLIRRSTSPIKSYRLLLSFLSILPPPSSNWYFSKRAVSLICLVTIDFFLGFI